MRRIELPVGVAYGTDPDRVLKILVDVAGRHPEVLKEPEAAALFLGFGDSSLDFSLRCWTGQFERFLVVRSDLFVAVNHALSEAGIEIPFPQRDLHLRSVAEGIGPVLPAIQGSAGGSSKKPDDGRS
jgi:small-conductance mechanosensitive channel